MRSNDLAKKTVTGVQSKDIFSDLKKPAKRANPFANTPAGQHKQKKMY